MSRIAILGASGQVGQLLRAVWPDGQDALWISRRSGRGLTQCDILRDPTALVGHLKGVQSVVCLAGVTHASKQDMSLNTQLAEVSIRAAHDAGVPTVLLASSAAVYGARAGVLREDAECQPISPYGLSKRAMEQRAHTLARSVSCQVCSLRIGNIAGADAILAGWRDGFQLDQFADGATPRRSYIGPKSLARALHHLGTEPHLPEVLNLAAPEPVSMGQLLDAADLTWAPRPAPASAIKSVHLSTERLEKHLPLDVLTSDPITLVNEWRAATGQTPQ